MSGLGTTMNILALLLAAQVAPKITSEAIEPDRYRLHVAGAAPTIAAAQAALMPKARALCGGRAASFGSFRYSQRGALDQELLCGARKPAVTAATPPPPDWAPSPEDQKAALAATYAFFGAMDRGDYSAAWSRLSEGMKASAPAAEWRRSAEAFNSRAGAVRARRVTEITWYNNPPDAPTPGLYVAADFSAGYEKLDFVCGYLMWRLQPDGSFVLTREEQNVVDKATAKRLASIDREPLRAQMGCKD
jgi:hypothetical protein